MDDKSIAVGLMDLQNQENAIDDLKIASHVAVSVGFGASVPLLRARLPRQDQVRINRLPPGTDQGGG